MTSPRRPRQVVPQGLTRSAGFGIVAAFVALAFLVAVNLQTTAQAARVQTKPCQAHPVEDETEAPSCAQLRTVVSQLNETNKQLVEAQKEIARLRNQLNVRPSPTAPKPTASGPSASGPTASGLPPPEDRSSTPGAEGTSGASPPGDAPSPSSPSEPSPSSGPGGGHGGGGGPPSAPPAPTPPVLPSPGPTCAVNVLGICIQLNGNSPLGGRFSPGR